MRDHNDIWPWLEDLVSYAVANSEMDALMQRAHFEIDQAFEEEDNDQPIQASMLGRTMHRQGHG